MDATQPKFYAMVGRTRVAAEFPKKCTLCLASVTESQWEELPAACGGLFAMGLEWRNHTCNGTLCVTSIELSEEISN